MKPAHRAGAYQRLAARLVATAYARDAAAALGLGEPTRCWRPECGRTLAEHEAHRDGKRPTWTAGHIVDGDALSPLAAEASTCNFSEGAKHGHRLRSAARFRTSRRW